MLGIISERPGQGDRLGYLRMDEVAVAALPASVGEPGSFEIGNELFQLRRHEFTSDIVPQNHSATKPR